MKKQFNLIGDMVHVRSYEDSDLSNLIEIGNDERIWEYYKLGGNNKAVDIVWIREDEKREKGILFDFVLQDKKKNKTIGYTALCQVNYVKKTGMIGSTFIHPEYWGTGHNQESKKLIIEFAFRELELEKLKYVCNVLNKRSYQAALKLGFELIKIEEKGRKNTDGTWADFAHFELNKLNQLNN